MSSVILTIRSGPHAGRRFDFELGRVGLGRDPGPGGLKLPGDMAVGRLQGELYWERGRVGYRNLGGGEAQVNGKAVAQSCYLASGDVLKLGSLHEIEVQFAAGSKSTVGGRVAGPLARGALANPLVRVLLVAYLAGMIALGVYLAVSGDESAAEAFDQTRAEYTESYQPDGVSAQVLEHRLAEAERLVRELGVLERKERWVQARGVCRQLMALDSDPDSPIYRFAARRMAALAGR